MRTIPENDAPERAGEADPDRARLEALQERYDLAIGGSGIGVWDHDYRTNELYWSPEFRRIMGVPDGAPASVEALIALIHPDDRERCMSSMTGNGGAFDLQHRVVRPDGGVVWINAKGRAMYGADGTPRRLAGVVTDITQEVEARDFRREIWVILSDLSLPMEDKVQGVLDLACRRLGLEYGGVARIDGEDYELIYQSLPDCTARPPSRGELALTYCSQTWQADDICAMPDIGQTRFAGGEGHRRSGFETYIGAPLVVGGERFGTLWLAGRKSRASYSVWDESIVLLLAQAVGREIGRTRHVQALKDSEQRFVMATRAASVGITEWRSDETRQYWSDNLYRLLGYEPGEIEATQDMFVSLMHPDDRDRVAQSVRTAMREGNAVQTEFRLQHAARGYRWVLGSVMAGLDCEGKRRLIGSVMDIHDLKLAQERAEAANIAKTQFLATMSHEIRTPLNGILGMAAALERTGLDEGQMQMLNVLSQSGGALLQVINQILDLSKIESGKTSLDIEPFDLEELIAPMAAMHEMKAGEKGLSLTAELQPGARGAYAGDAGRIRQILNNLMSNAVKFTESGAVTLSVTEEGADADGRAALCFEVRDTGAGIAPGDQEKLFSPFTQLDSSSTRRHEGSGLGLAISRRLAEMMGGTLELESAPGEGSTFRFRVALAPADAMAKPSSAPAADDAGMFGGDAPLRVLSVDDHPTNRMVLEALLQPTGAAVTSAASGPEALEMLAGEAFDVVLLDIQMPGMDGPATLVEIRRMEREQGRGPTPVIAVTANALAHQVQDYLEAGFDGHVGKPIVMDALTAAIRGVLAPDEAERGPERLAAAS